MKTILSRFYVYIPFALVAILQNMVHESLHYLAARLFGEDVSEFRLLTNGWLTSQVIYATPMDQRAGFYWLVIAWLPILATTLIGFCLYASRKRLFTPWPPINLGIWYVGVLFMTIDPLYFGVLSWFMQRSDVNAAEIMGWPVWSFRLLAFLICSLAIRLVFAWRAEAQTQLKRYQVL